MHPSASTASARARAHFRRNRRGAATHGSTQPSATTAATRTTPPLQTPPLRGPTSPSPSVSDLSSSADVNAAPRPVAAAPTVRPRQLRRLRQDAVRGPRDPVAPSRRFRPDPVRGPRVENPAPSPAPPDPGFVVRRADGCYLLDPADLFPAAQIPDPLDPADPAAHREEDALATAAAYRFFASGAAAAAATPSSTTAAVARRRTATRAGVDPDPDEECARMMARLREWAGARFEAERWRFEPERDARVGG